MPTATITSPLPLVRADGHGYTYAGTSVDGFAERPELSLEARVRLARLAERYKPKRLSEAQRELLATPEAEHDASRQPSAAQVGFQADEEDAARAWQEGVYAELSQVQQEWVAQPSLHPKLSDAIRYPLTLGQLHVLSGASERQLRHWTDEDLIPAHRAGTHRRYYSAAAARALLLADMTPQQVAALIALRRGGAPGRRLVVLIGSVMASVAGNAPVDERERGYILQGARALVDHRAALASAGAGNIRSVSVADGEGARVMSDKNPATGMRGNRARDEDGRLREKRGDTLVGTIEDEYGIDLGVRSDMRLDTYRKRAGITSVKEIVEQARER